MLIGFQPHFRHCFGNINRKLVRRGILTGVQTGAAVVAQVRQIVNIRLAECQTLGHGREYGAKPFAIAAGVTDLHHPFDFRLRFGDDLRLDDQLFKRLHDVSPAAPGGLLTGNAAECGPDRHAYAGGIAFAQYVASHHFAGDKQVAARLTGKVNGGVLIDVQPEVGEGDPDAGHNHNKAAYR